MQQLRDAAEQRQRREKLEKAEKCEPQTDTVTRYYWQPRCRLTHFQMKTCYNGELLQCQLFGGLLVTMATAAFDFGTAS